MKSFSKVELRRCRPLLGTFVDITARGDETGALEGAINFAFSAVERVHRLMSFHDRDSDVSRINREGFPKGVTVDAWTWRVLKTARDLARESNGAFDIAIASLLTDGNYLPKRGYCFDAGATWRDIFLRENGRVICRRRAVIDLGGIAKGFAVDRAIDALRDAGVASGVVNAGGDLRVFGSSFHRVYVRHPAFPGLAAGLVRLRNRALATSGLYFVSNLRGSPLIDGRNRRPLTDSISVTVSARDCMTADALGKIVFALGEKAAPLLERHRADAVLLEHSGRPRWISQPPCDRTR